MAARSEPASGSREQLAPHLVTPEHRRKEPPLLLLGAVGEERGAHHADGDGEHAVGHAEARLLLVEDGALDRATAAAAVLARPGDAGPSPAGQHALPLAAALHVDLFAVVRWTTCQRRSRPGAPSGWRWPRARRGPRRGTPPPRGCRRSPPPLRLEHVLVRGLQSVRVSSSSASTAGGRSRSPLPERGEEPLDAFDHPGRAHRREHLEGVLGAVHLGVEHRLASTPPACARRTRGRPPPGRACRGRRGSRRTAARPSCTWCSGDASS